MKGNFSKMVSEWIENINKETKDFFFWVIQVLGPKTTSEIKKRLIRMIQWGRGLGKRENKMNLKTDKWNF